MGLHFLEPLIISASPYVVIAAKWSNRHPLVALLLYVQELSVIRIITIVEIFQNLIQIFSSLIPLERMLSKFISNIQTAAIL